MERRELLSLGGIAAMAGAFAASVEETGQAKRVLRIYADADGNAHVEELPIATKAGRIRRTEAAAVTGFTSADYPSSSLEDWHRTPGRQFSISLSGEIRCQYRAARGTPFIPATSSFSRICKPKVTLPASLCP